jgi:phage tail-like protein
MTLDQDQIKSSYPLPVYNYRVTVGGATLGFSEVSGLNVEHEPVTYKHGLSFVLGDKIIPGMPKQITLTMKRGITKAENGSILVDWFQETYANPLRNSKQDIQIDLCDETGNAVIRWKVLGALPVKLDAPTFDASSNEVAVETLELVAHSISVDYKLS